jgi:hypothetical protein
MRAHIENNSCNTGSIVACGYCGRYLEMVCLSKYNSSYVFYANYECKGSIKKQRNHIMTHTTPVRSPENKITFLTLLFIDMSRVDRQRCTRTSPGPVMAI